MKLRYKIHKSGHKKTGRAHSVRPYLEKVPRLPLRGASKLRGGYQQGVQGGVAVV